MSGAVLLIDGDGDTREILRALLTWKGHRVLESESADDGLRLANDDPPGVVVTEYLIPPGRRGRCVVEELRQNPRTASIPTIVFTSNRSAESRYRVEAAGALYLGKPASPLTVLEAIRRLISAVSQ
jgi:two-component system, OmpR family, phosphate regulon response regulator PhoB